MAYETGYVELNRVYLRLLEVPWLMKVATFVVYFSRASLRLLEVSWLCESGNFGCLFESYFLEVT